MNKKNLDESDLRGLNVETSERTSRGSVVRDPSSGYQMAALTHLDIRR